MRLPSLVLTCVLAAIAATSSGCACADNHPEPVDITVKDGNPELTGQRISCRCTIEFSKDAQDKAKLPASTTEVVKPCLPTDYKDKGADFCTDKVGEYEKHLAEQLGLFVAEGAGVGLTTVCGGPYLDGPPKEGVKVQCMQIPVAGTDLTMGDETCKVPGPDPDVCGIQLCKLTSDSSKIPPENCLVQGTSIVADQCNCTMAHSNCGNGGVSERPICLGNYGTGKVSSPMTVATSRGKSVEIDNAASSIAISVRHEVSCLPFGCVFATGSASPHLSGTLGLYGGPCPGRSCNIQLDGILKLDDFSMTTSAVEVFNRTDTIKDARIAISALSSTIAVGADGTAMIPPQHLTYEVVGYHNDELLRSTGANQQPAVVKIDWDTRTFAVSNVQFSVADGSATLNLRGTFEPSLLDLLERIPSWDNDGDGVPDRTDNCRRVANADQTSLPPMFGDLPTLSVSACTAGDVVTLMPPVVSDPCDKRITLTGRAVAVDGTPITPIPIGGGPMTVEPAFDAAGLPTTPTAVAKGSAVLPAGSVTIEWTATDTNHATAVATQVVKSSIVPTLYATGALNIGPAATIKTSSTAPATIANPTGSIGIGVAATLGNVLGGGQVVLGNRAVVTGFINTKGAVVFGNGSTVVGAVTQDNPAVVFPPPFGFTPPAAPPTSLSAVDVAPYDVRTLPPGTYGSLRVQPQATLRISSGSYHFASFDLHPNSNLQVDSANGSVTLAIDDALDLKGGTITDSASPTAPDLLVGYFGTQPVMVRGPFNGALIAPKASVTLAGGPFTGQFAAMNLEVGSQTNVLHRPYHCAP